MSIITDQSRTLVGFFNLGWETTLISLFWATTAFGQPVLDKESLPSNSVTETEATIESLILETVSTRAEDLLSNEYERGLTAQDNSSSESEDQNQVDPFTKTTGGQLRIELTDPSKPFTYGFGSIISYPDALISPTRDVFNVPAESTQLSIFTVKGHARQRLGSNHALLLEALLDPTRYGLDFRYGNNAPSLPGAFAVNIFTQNARSPAFENGDEDVDLPNGNVPWVIRLGGGIEYVQPLTSKLDGAVGINYQIVSTRDAAFTNSIEPEDALGNPLTFSEDGQDTLLTLDASLLFDTTDDPNAPTHGSRLRFGTSQSIPVGDANILYNRLSASFSQFIPLNLFGFTEGPRTLILNFQAGTFIGDDVPSYQAFNLGGSETVRGFDVGEVGTSSSFIKTTAEYRFPIAAFRLLKQDIGLRGTLFVDYGNDLETADRVMGNPADARDKPGDGLGYGLGLSADTSFGRFRGEFGFNSDGGSQFHFAVGDRF
ncbi:MAG: BamA/TamA family outer membrane protein [Xenococcaceae cyanobacterium MO_207.B15]|nr:BamA/TamA family outer membrane protein [Xenococcaceae cyanobacterium MO_207.B15]